MNIAMEQMRKGQRSGSVLMVKEGFSEIVNELINQGQLNIRKNHNVTRITRVDGKVELTLHHDDNTFTDQVDILFSSLALSKFSICTDIQEYQQEMYTNQSCAYLTTYLVKSDVQLEMGTISSSFDHMMPGNEAKPFSQRFTKDILQPNTPFKTGDDVRLWLHYNDQNYSENTLLNKLDDHFKWAYKDNYEVVYKKITPFFYRWSNDGIQKNFPWELMKAQGNNNIFHIGGSVYYESMADIISYNHMIINKIIKSNLDNKNH